MKTRETASLVRELLGGNGILADFLVAKVVACILSYISAQSEIISTNNTILINI